MEIALTVVRTRALNKIIFIANEYYYVCHLTM